MAFRETVPLLHASFSWGHSGKESLFLHASLSWWHSGKESLFYTHPSLEGIQGKTPSFYTHPSLEGSTEKLAFRERIPLFTLIPLLRNQQKKWMYPLFTHIPLFRAQLKKRRSQGKNPSFYTHPSLETRQKKWHSGKESLFLNASLSWGLNRASGVQGENHSFYSHPSLEGSTEKVAFKERIPLFTHIPLLRALQKKWHSGKESLFLNTSLSWRLNRKSGIQGKSPSFYTHASLEGSTEKVAFRERISLFTHIPLLRAQQKKWHSRKEPLFLHTSLSWGLNRKSGIQGKNPSFYTHPSLEGSTEKVLFRERIPIFTHMTHPSLEGSTEKVALKERTPLFTRIPLLRAQQKKWRSGKEFLFLHTSLSWGLNRKKWHSGKESLFLHASLSWGLNMQKPWHSGKESLFFYASLSCGLNRKSCIQGKNRSFYTLPSLAGSTEKVSFRERIPLFTRIPLPLRAQQKNWHFGRKSIGTFIASFLFLTEIRSAWERYQSIHNSLEV